MDGVSLLVGDEKITVIRDEDYKELYDVIRTNKGIGDEDGDHTGIHADDLESLIKGLFLKLSTVALNSIK